MYFTLFKNIAIGLLICILTAGEYVFSQSFEYDSLFINEISPTNFQFTDEHGDLDDWIEIYNAGPSAINIEGLYITDDLNNPLRWQIGISYELSPPNSEKSTVLLRKLLENENFKNEFIQHTYTFIETIFTPERVNRITDSLVDLINPVIDMQVAKWGVNIPDLGWGITMEGSREEWEENIQDYKDFFSERPYYMKQHINDYFKLDATFLESNNPQKFSIYPNPGNGIINIRALNGCHYPSKVEIFNSLGQKVFELSFDTQSYYSGKQLDISNLPDGMYFLNISNDIGKYIEKLIIAK